MTTMESRTLSVRIERPLAEVYDFLAEPANVAKWAAGLTQDADVTFATRNEYGVLDHSVLLPAGQEVYVPMRVIRNGSGTEVLFTLFRLPDMTDEAFGNDEGAVQRDLDTLKALLES
jgi:hypothetical protein